MGSHQKPLLPPDMPPMMPFDLSRFEGAPPMVPPLFPYQMPPVGLPGIPIPPPPAPQQIPTEPEEYELEMAAMANEIMQQGGYGQQPIMPPPQFGAQHQPVPPQTPPPIPEEDDESEENETLDPYMAAEIASVVHTLTTSQLTYVLSAFKLFFDKSPKNAKRFLVNNPQLVYALLHAQYVLGNSDKMMLPLNSVDKNLANLNRKDRDTAAHVEAQNEAEEEAEGIDNEHRLQSGRNKNANFDYDDNTVEYSDVLPPPPSQAVEAQRVDPAKREPSRSVGSNRKRESKFKNGGTPAAKKVVKSHREHDSRNVGHPDSSPIHQQAEAPQEELPPTMPHPEWSTPSAQPYEAPSMAPQMSPAFMPMQMPPMIPPPIPRTIEEIMMEVQPAPPILVEEVLKNTEILTNIQRATVAEMQSWPPEQRLQVLSIKLALHLRGITINL